ncbi:MAG: hypothetical protein IJU76_10295 [Desulfovibrionaceae bacterium]|nr:hypothetical protein [Desulfovibrionaceae bacterium]
MALRVLFYGDSNTWGYIRGGDRYPPEVRFPTLAVASLPDTYALEEGLNGRNCAFSHPLCDANLLGGATFASVFQKALPVDVLCLMLGTNDALPPLYRSASDIASDLRQIIRCAKKLADRVHILLIAPVPINTTYLSELEEEMGACSALRPEPLAPALRALAAEESVDFLDAGERIAEADGGDGVHLSEHAHAQIAECVRAYLAQLPMRTNP